MIPVNKPTRRELVYLALKSTTNLSKIRKDLKLSKEHLNNLLTLLRKEGLILRKGKGYYEVVNSSKQTTKYGSSLPKDISRGHGFIWTIKLPKEIEGWEQRISKLDSKEINYKLVGAKGNTPRIKVLGRKVWLCNDHIRIFDKEDNSYYGDNAIQSKRKGLMTALEIVYALENKLGFPFKNLDIQFRKEHYALIKNDLAIAHNKKGEILRVLDESGEWLLIDDSLGEGGELETVGKNAFDNNLKLQRWWNEHKETKFEVTPKFILNTMNGIQQNQSIFDKNMKSHLEVLDKLGRAVSELREEISKFAKTKHAISEPHHEK